MLKKVKTKKSKAKPLVLVVLGPTASGKTALAIYLANKYSGEIVSADSRQVYKGMDIGSGKDLGDYKATPYHLIDVVKPQTVFNLANYQKKAKAAILDISSRKKLPILVGGSGLYLQAIVDNYQLNSVKPNLAKRKLMESLTKEELYLKLKKLKPAFAKQLNNSDKNNKRRLSRYLEIVEAGAVLGRKQTADYDFLVIGLSQSDSVLKNKINQRLKKRLEKEDMIGEVRRLKKAGLSWRRLKSFGLEYKFIAKYLLGELDYESMVEKLATAIYRFAKRQNTWFKRWQKQGQKINFLKNKQAAEKLLKEYIKEKS